MIEKSYFAVIHKDETSDFGVSFPEVEGCFSAGDTKEDAIEKAKEALEEYLTWLLQDGEPLPDCMDGEEVTAYALEKCGEDGLVDVVRVTVQIDEEKILQSAVEERRSIRLKEMADGQKDYTARSWIHGAWDHFNALLMFVGVCALFVWSAVTGWIKEKTQILREKISGKDEDYPYAGIRMSSDYRMQEPLPQWMRAENKEKEWIKTTLKQANPGTLISCHDCPFRLTEQGEGLNPGQGGWASWEEREALEKLRDRWRKTISVCGHPANGKWGNVRYGAHTPDEKTCPRALLANMNPIRRAYWKWRMKQHIKKHGSTSKVL